MSLGGWELHPISIMTQKLYKYYVENLKSLEIAIKSTALSTRKSISEQNNNSIRSFVRLYAFLIGAWAETRLGKLLLERTGFSKNERKEVLREHTQLDQWNKVVEMAFRKHFRVPRAKLEPPNIPHTVSRRYLSLKETIEVHLSPVILVRNKLAHGQWIYPLNSDASNVEQGKYILINKENLLSLQFKSRIVKTLADIIHDLVVSPPTFDRDFDQRFNLLVSTVNNLNNRSYDKYRESLIEKRSRGIKMRKNKT